jgi:hypothetical protein
LGHGDDSSWDQPKMIHSLEPARIGTKIIQIVCGGSHSGAVTESGRIYMWGLNKNGQCGIGSKSDSVSEPRPVDMSSIRDVRANFVSCGRNHSVMVTTEGRVFVWGAGSYGRLGLNESPRNQLVPAEIALFQTIPVHSLKCGDFHNLALGHDCSVYAWGYGTEGQTGQGDMFHLKIPRRIEYFDSLQIVRIACGLSWSMAVSRSGTLYGWGYGDGGWLGIGSSTKLPQVEPEAPLNKQQEHAQVQSFDSRLNVLTPQRVKSLSHHVVDNVVCGGGHTLVFASPKNISRSYSSDNMSVASAASGVSHIDDKKYVDSRFSGYDRKDASSKEERERLTTGSFANGPLTGKIDKSLSFQLSETKSDPFRDHSNTVQSDIHDISDEAISQSSTNTISIKSNQQAASTSSTFYYPLQETEPEELTAQLISWSRHRKLAELEYALSLGQAVDVNVRDAAGNTPLIVACQNGHTAVVKLLVSMRPDLDIRCANKKGNTALHFCFAYGFEDLGEHLIALGADEYATNAEGLTCYEGLTHADLDKI